MAWKSSLKNGFFLKQKRRKGYFNALYGVLPPLFGMEKTESERYGICS